MEVLSSRREQKRVDNGKGEFGPILRCTSLRTIRCVYCSVGQMYTGKENVKMCGVEWFGIGSRCCVLDSGDCGGGDQRIERCLFGSRILPIWKAAFRVAIGIERLRCDAAVTGPSLIGYFYTCFMIHQRLEDTFLSYDQHTILYLS